MKKCQLHSTEILSSLGFIAGWSPKHIPGNYFFTFYKGLIQFMQNIILPATAARAANSLQLQEMVCVPVQLNE